MSNGRPKSEAMSIEEARKELMQDTRAERRKVHVLMSIAEPDITKVLILSLQKGLGNKYDLSISEISTVGQLLSHAKNEPVDLCILLLNNMQFSDTTSFKETHRWAPLEVISHLRKIYEKPVIALTGNWPGDSSCAEAEAIRAGASCLFWLPVDRQLLIDAVEQCLREAGSLSSR